MPIRRLAKRVLQRAWQPKAPEVRPPREPPPFVPNPAEAGMESDPADLLSRREGGEVFVFVDVRAHKERDSQIPQALHISMGELPVRWGEIEEYGGTPVCYCASGGQSINAAALLRERGLLNATSILGGLPAWEDAGGDTVEIE